MRLALAILLVAACGSSKSAAPKPERDAGAPSIDARPLEPDKATFPGDPYRDPALAPGTLQVKSPGPNVLQVVAIDLDGKVTMTEHQTTGTGDLELTGLVTDGSVAYHVVGANLGAMLESAPIVMPADEGMRVEITGPVADGQPPQNGEVWISVIGVNDATDVQLVDVETGAGVTPDGQFAGDYGPMFRFARATPSAVYVARLRHSSGEHVSRPFRLLPYVGVTRTLMPAPFPFIQCDGDLHRKDKVMHGWTRCDVFQYGGAPRRLATALRFGLPAGATNVTVLDPRQPAQPDVLTGALVWTGPMAPGGSVVGAEFDLPVTDGVVQVALDVPTALVQLRLTVEASPTIQISGLVGAQYQAPDFARGDTSHMIGASYLPAGQRVSFTISGVTPPTPCDKLVVAKWTANGDPAPAPDVSAKQRDGTEVKLSSRRGKPVLLNLFASWTPPSAQEIPKLIAAERAFAAIGVDVVIVASDDDWPQVDNLIDPNTGVTVWLDPPHSAQYTLGAVAHAFGTKALPETYLIDAQGLVRAWIVNSRDWTTPEAVGCIQSLTQPWTGNVTEAPPPYTPPPPQLGGTLTLDPKLTVPPNTVLYLLVRPSDGGAPMSVIRLDNPTFPQSFAFSETNQLTPDRPIAGTVQITATIDLDGDPMTGEVGSMSGVAYATAGDLGVRLTIDQMVR